MLADLWPGLDLRHLAAFEAVARHRSFARAAEALGYTQPAVSQQVAALEKIVGARLVERSSGRAEARLTEAGTRLLAHVQQIGGSLAAARQDLTDLARGETGTLKVGSFQTASARILPTILRRYHEARPAVDVELLESADDIPLLEDVRLGLLDFTFCLLPIETVPIGTGGFDHLTLAEDAYVLVSQEPVDVESLDDLARQPLILYRSCRSGVILDTHLRNANPDLHVVFRSDDNAALIEMVRAGVGVALLPQLWIGSGVPGLVTAPLRGIVPPRVIGLAWRRDRELSPAQQAFVDVIADCYPVAAAA
jgi:molybdate transport repressor ModE-like protein